LVGGHRVSSHRRSRGEGGASRIFFYNWPTYVGTWIVALMALFFSPHLPGWTTLIVVGACFALVWSLASLAVSHYVYEISELVGGRWVAGLLSPEIATWATIHAGLDAEIDLDSVLPGRCFARLDIFDARLMTSPSITRARRRTALS